MIKLIETYEDTIGQDIEVFQCENCGRTFSIYAGGDIACCPCECEESGDEDG